MTIDLNRRFQVLSENANSLERLNNLSAFIKGSLSWEDLLKNRRVVILAEAGSGKTTELQLQSQKLASEDKLSFYAPLHLVAQRGIAEALKPALRLIFENWKHSDKHAYIFLDSVDETKDAQVKLQIALDSVAEGILGAEGRCTIVISGRYTDWDFQRDLVTLKDTLAIPAEPIVQDAISSDETLIRMLDREELEEERTAPPIEQPVIVLMAHLDEEHIRKFVTEKGMTNCDQFIQQIDESNLWGLVRTPVDLDWLSGYWAENNRLGSLEEMVELSVRMRLQEINPDRQRTDSVDLDRAKSAVDRLGSALVLSQSRNIILQASANPTEQTEKGISIRDSLPEWSDGDRIRLAARPIFDPDTLGRTRLKNDNNGTLRGFLFAKWLVWLIENNLTEQNIIDLLFADIYGTRVIRPSMRQTAAWLALWNTRVASEIARVEPLVLINGGDPSSLETVTRKQVLRAVVESLAGGEGVGEVDGDSLKRFMQPGLEEAISNLWQLYKNSEEARELILRAIWLGRYSQCIDIVEDALANYTDRYTRMFAGRALLDFGSEERKLAYAQYVTANCDSLPNIVIWDTIDKLFPTVLSINDFIQIVSAIDPDEYDGGLNIGWNADKLANRISTSADVRSFLAGLRSAYHPESRPSVERELIPVIIAATRRSMELAAPNDIPDEALDAAIFLTHEKRYGRRQTESNYGELFRNNAQRRQRVLWESIRKLSAMPEYAQHENIDIWFVNAFAIPTGIGPDDVEWLIADLTSASSESKKKTALNALLMIWRDNGQDPSLLATIRSTVNDNASDNLIIDQWTSPRLPSQAELEAQREIDQYEQERRQETIERNSSWRDFVERIKADPSVLLNPTPPNEQAVDTNLYNLKHLASMANRTRSTMYNLDVLRPVLGDAATNATTAAFKEYWKLCSPIAAVDRPVNEHNTIFSVESVGLMGLGLLSSSSADWISRLSDDEVRKAITFATLELNGFPGWAKDIANAKPTLFSEVIMNSISKELLPNNEDLSFNVLGDVAHASIEIKQAVAPAILEILRQNQALPERALNNLLAIARSQPLLHADLFELCIQRYSSSTVNNIRSLYLSCAIILDADAALDALEPTLIGMSAPDKRSLLTNVLPTMFGDGFDNGALNVDGLSADTLVRLVNISYDAMPPTGDVNRLDGRTYSPDNRDHAQRARGYLLKALAERPGEFIYRTLNRFSEFPDFGVPPMRMRELALKRAQLDGNLEPWSVADVIKFERTQSRSPRTTKDLCDLFLNQIKNLEHDLLNSEFAQGATLAHLALEKDVQIWFGDTLSKGQSYTVDREKHVVGEKEPDITIRSLETGATVPIEVKVAESWTLPQLEAALRTQLCGQYLRDRRTRYGVLLLVHQNPRPQGWEDTQGNMLSFVQVVSHLDNIAKEICSSSENAPQPRIAVIDVSSAYRKPASRKAQSAKSAKPKKAQRTED